MYLHAHNPDVMRFLDIKRENADAKIRIKPLSLGVVIPDTTFELAKRDAEMHWTNDLAASLSTPAYAQRMRDEIDYVIDLQEQVGLDVLVHGEPERNDMAQYFAEQLDGFIATRHGWVQSYGSRYVRPPILVGNVTRRQPMTVAWAEHARSRTDRPLEGMLTGPVTILCWSLVRDHLPLRRAGHVDCLEWAVHAFRLATSRVRDVTQIHTARMC